MRCYIKVSLNSTLKKDDDVDIIDFEAYKYDNINRNNIDNKNCTLNDYHKVVSVDLCRFILKTASLFQNPVSKQMNQQPRQIYQLFCHQQIVKLMTIQLRQSMKSIENQLSNLLKVYS